MGSGKEFMPAEGEECWTGGLGKNRREKEQMVKGRKRSVLTKRRKRTLGMR